MRWVRNAAVIAALAMLGACESTEQPQVDGAPEAAGVPEEAEVDTSEWSVEDEADLVLQAAGNLLAQTRRFSFRAEIMEEQVLESGAKIDTSREGTVHVRRPDGLVAVRHQASGERRLRYDGATAAIFDVPTNLYVQGDDPPPELDGFLDYLADHLNVPIPLGDVIVADPYAALREPALGGVHFGDALVRGSLCHHLGFGNGDIEWQIWVQKEGRPLIRKAVINYRDERGSPRWEAHLSDWNLEDDLPDAAFTFVPPEGSRRIRLAQLPDESE
jgi:hypothetical protein